jgi:V/A-type H+-transporting ATPase subunit I
MNLKMTPLEIVGLKANLQVTVHTLQRLGCVQIDELADASDISARPLTIDHETLRTQEEFKSLAARVEGLLGVLDVHLRSPPAPGHLPGKRNGSPAGAGRAMSEAAHYRPRDLLAKARAGVAELTPAVQSLTSRREQLQAELEALPRYETTLRKLLPIIPPSARDPGNVSVGILVSRAHTNVLDLVRKHALELTGGRAEVMAGNVDDSTWAMLLVFPGEFTGEIEALLGREDVSRLRLPTELGQGPPDVALAALHCRMIAIPEEIEEIDRQLAGLAAQWCEKLVVWRAALGNELEAINVLSRFGETDMTFVLMGWVPTKDVDKVESALRETVGETALVRQLVLTPALERRVPVVLQNPRLAQPFESLVCLLSLPRQGGLDPTLLMALFMPIFFGMILGDVGYGTLLLVFSLGLLHKFRVGVMPDILRVLAMGAGWSILFGFLYGEAFGTLGEHLGMHALWLERASPEHVTGLLIMTLAVGSVHITLGLILGVWEAFFDHRCTDGLDARGLYGPRHWRTHPRHCAVGRPPGLGGHSDRANRVHRPDRQHIVLLAHCRHRPGLGLPGPSRQRHGGDARQPHHRRYCGRAAPRIEPGDGCL